MLAPPPDSLPFSDLVEFQPVLVSPDWDPRPTYFLISRETGVHSQSKRIANYTETTREINVRENSEKDKGFISGIRHGGFSCQISPSADTLFQLFFPTKHTGVCRSARASSFYVLPLILVFFPLNCALCVYNSEHHLLSILSCSSICLFLPYE